MAHLLSDQVCFSYFFRLIYDHSGSAGLYTGEAGFLGYYEICTRVQQQGWTKVFDEEQKSNYAYQGVEWVGFDDTYSIGFKVRQG